jgi:succinate dehydrogenase / fumarate reductase, cytochrome b subunit
MNTDTRSYDDRAGARDPVPSSERPARARPVYLDLPRIRLPVPGLVSFLHRVSGALLFVVGIPLLLAGVGMSLASPDSFAQLRSTAAHPLAKLVLLGLAWAYIHHFCAGIRFLLLDLHAGIELPGARRSSVIVLVVSVALTIAVGVRLW